MWLSHPSFPGLVKDAWSGTPNLPNAICSFTTKAKIWNKDHFGNIFYRKQRICARLKGVQTALVNNPNNFLIDLEKSLLTNLSSLANLEVEYWSMKSRITWVIEGDRNTTFFHNLALICWRRNHISSMKDSMVNWLNGDQEIVDYIRQGFIHLFTTSHCSAPRQEWQPLFWRCSLKAEDISKLEHSITNKEILAALHSLKPYKALGPDGFHTGFFQRFWLIVGNSVKNEVKQTLCTRKVLEYLNKTLITLIPKCNSPKALNNYRSICLCNTVYKVITKLIVTRLQPALDYLVSPLQAAFVPKRKGVDNAIIVRELIHSISKKRGRGGVMAIKIDLEKAYDRLE